MSSNKKQATIELLSRHQCLLSNLPFRLPPEIINSHQISYSPTLETYLFDINLINSLRRILKESEIVIEDLPADIIGLFATLGKGKALKYAQMPDEVGCWILKPHQQSAIDFFAKRGGKIIIGDAWAMGKTVSALAIIKTFAFQTVLIVCPQILVNHWQKHLSQVFDQISIQIIKDPSPCITKQTTSRYLITSYCIWNQIASQTKKINCIIFDEPQLSSINSQNIIENAHTLSTWDVIFSICSWYTFSRSSQRLFVCFGSNSSSFMAAFLIFSYLSSANTLSRSPMHFNILARPFLCCSSLVVCSIFRVISTRSLSREDSLRYSPEQMVLANSTGPQLSLGSSLKMLGSFDFGLGTVAGAGALAGGGITGSLMPGMADGKGGALVTLSKLYGRLLEATSFLGLSFLLFFSFLFIFFCLSFFLERETDFELSESLSESSDSEEELLYLSFFLFFSSRSFFLSFFFSFSFSLRFFLSPISYIYNYKPNQRGRNVNLYQEASYVNRSIGSLLENNQTRVLWIYQAAFLDVTQVFERLLEESLHLALGFRVTDGVDFIHNSAEIIPTVQKKINRNPSIHF